MYLLEEDGELELGCQFGDVICLAAESSARGLGSFVGWLAEIVLGSQKLAPGTTLWDNAIDEAGNWFALSIVVMMASGIIGLVTGLFSMKPGRVWMTILGLAAAIPSTYLAIGLGGELLTISDQLSDLALTRLGGKDGFENVFRAAGQGGTGTDLGGAAVDLLSGGVASAIPTILMLIGLILGLILMSFALAFRNLGLMVLIAFAPLAFMAVPMKGGWGITKKWALAGIALLLSKPLMFGILAMLLKTADGMALFSAQTLTVMTGLFVVSFMPMMAYSFFSFLGSGNEKMAGQDVGGQAGQKVSQGAGRAAQQLGPGRGSFGGGAGGGSAPKPPAGGGGGSSPAGNPTSGGGSQPGDKPGGKPGDGTPPAGGKDPGGDPPGGKPPGGQPGGPPGGTPPGGGRPGGGGSPTTPSPGRGPSTPPPSGGAPGGAGSPSPRVPDGPKPSTPSGGGPRPASPAPQPKW